MHLKASRYPVGGALEFVGAIEQRYLDLGGEIDYRSQVAEILVEADPSGQGDRAVGVRLDDGTEHRADIVISAADGHTTIFDMLGGNYVNDEIRGTYETLPLYQPILFISLGVDRSFEARPPSVGGEVFLLDEPVSIAGKEWKWMASHIYTFDPTLAPEDKTLVRVFLTSDYQYWRDLREQGREQYRAEKEQAADQVIALLDRRYPGFADQVEMRDVATPMTFERYTGNWQGAWMGWVNSPQTMNMHVSKTLPGLDSFYMVGTWVMNNGLTFAAVSGRHVTQIICSRDGKPFVTSIP
jgi:phytoene dehydrogenase-like protein